MDAADTAVAEILWLPEAAKLERDAGRPVTIKNGRSLYVDGSGAVVFSIAVRCDDVVRDIRGHFARTEWRLRATQYLNPRIATSFTSGCQHHGGGLILAMPLTFRAMWSNRAGGSSSRACSANHTPVAGECLVTTLDREPIRLTRPATSMTSTAAAILAAIGCVVLSGACSREQLAREAEARAKAWGIPAVRITRDIVYAEYGPRQLKLDLYRPPASADERVIPGIVVVRGGKWEQGDKEGLGYIAGQLAMAGFVTAAIEYRTAGEAKFPAAVHDVKAAVRWMRRHAAEHGIDPQAIGAIGGSAGAHLVAMLATTASGQFEGEGGNAGTSSEVQAVVAMGGAYDLEPKGDVGPEFISAVTNFIGAPLEAHADALAAASPARHVSSRSAPLLLLHSTTDPVAPFGRAVEMERAYRRVGARVTLGAIDAPGVHGFWGDPRYFPEARRQAVEFLHRHLGG